MPKPRFRLICVESLSSASALLHDLLSLTFPDCLLEVVSSYHDFSFALPGRGFDIILGEESLSSADDWKLVQFAAEHAPSTPFILVSEKASTERMTEAVRAGVWEQILTSNLPALPFVICRAIQRKTAMIEETSRRYADTLALTDEAICCWNLAGELLYANEAARELYSWKHQEILGKPDTELFAQHTASVGVSAYVEHCTRHSSWSGEVTRCTLPGDVLTLTTQCRARRDSLGQLVEIIEVTRKSAEQAPVRADGTEIPEARRIAHELNNILNALSSAGGLLKSRSTKPEDSVLFEILESSIARGGNLARKLSGSAQPADVQTTAPVPQKSAEVKLARAGFGNESLRGTGEQILLIDDEEAVCKLLRNFLQHNGYKVETVTSGNSAIAMYRANPGYDLVMCDLGLPDVKGDHVIRELKQLNPAVNFIVSSGASEADLSEWPADSVLAKPYDLQTALRTVRVKLDAVVAKKAELNSVCG